MAKIKKVRNKKKASVANRNVYHISRVVNDTYNRLCFIGSSVTKGVEVKNMGRIKLLLAPREAMLAENLILDRIRNEEHTWYFWLGVFCVDGKDTWCEPIAGEMLECKVSDFDTIITKLIEAAIDMADTDHPHAKGYGWVATPTYSCDLVASEEGFVEMFMSMDVTNEAKRNVIFLDHAVQNSSIESAVISPVQDKFLDQCVAVQDMVKDKTLTVDEAIAITM